MSEFQMVSIQDSCDILDSMRIPLNAEERSEISGNIPYYGANGVQGYINDYIFDEDLILLAEDGGYFEEFDSRPIAYKISGKSWVNNHAHILRARPNFHLDYVFYSLQHKNIVSFIKGGTRSKLNQSELKEITFTAPSLPQQQKIAKILTTVDNLIKQTQALIDKYTAIKQGMMADLFTRGLDLTGTPETNPNYGQLRPSVEDAPELYKETELGWVPKEWEALTIGEALNSGLICLIQDGNHGEAYPRSSDFSDEGVPFLSAKHISPTGKIDFGNCPRLPDSYLRKLRIGFGVKGDVIFAHNATVGPVGFVESVASYIASTSTTIYRSGDSINNKFLFYYLSSILFQDQVARVMGQTTRNQVPIGAQKRLTIVIPPITEQLKIVAKLDSLSTIIESEINNKEKAKKQKKGLMQDLLTGKVPVNA